MWVAFEGGREPTQTPTLLNIRVRYIYIDACMYTVGSMREVGWRGEGGRIVECGVAAARRVMDR